MINSRNRNSRVNRRCDWTLRSTVVSELVKWSMAHPGFPKMVSSRPKFTGSQGYFGPSLSEKNLVDNKSGGGRGATDGDRKF